MKRSLQQMCMTLTKISVVLIGICAMVPKMCDRCLVFGRASAQRSA
jgi:hypothetical protein